MEPRESWLSFTAIIDTKSLTGNNLITYSSLEEKHPFSNANDPEYLPITTVLLWQKYIYDYFNFCKNLFWELCADKHSHFERVI